MLPMMSPVAESFNLAFVNGKTIAGCENVKGIKYKCNYRTSLNRFPFAKTYKAIVLNMKEL